MVAVFAPPHTYTGEPVVEFHLHGSPLLVSSLLTRLTRLGVRPARPGEFSLRAFIHGKRDLTQVEAINDLVAARSLPGLKLAAGQLVGTTRRAVEQLARDVLALASRLEAELDFPDDVPELPSRELRERFSVLVKALDRLASSYESARRCKEGFRVVLAGAPNVGKSSLFNALLNTPRAVVSREKGTTRDYLEEYLPDSPYPVLLVDMAGFRRGRSSAERSGVRFAGDQLSRADLVLLLVDSFGPGTEEDRELAARTRGRRRILCLTKSDLGAPPAQLVESLAVGDEVIPLSARTGSGLETLREALVGRAAGSAGEEQFEVMLTNQRQFDAVVSAGRSLREARARCDDVPRDILSSMVREGLHSLNEVTGRGAMTDQILEEIFSRFCIGK